jgi:hypothetical protein
VFYHIWNLKLQFLKALIFQDRFQYYLKTGTNHGHLLHECYSARFGFYAHVFYRFAFIGCVNTCPLKVSCASYIKCHIYIYIYIFIYIYIYILTYISEICICHTQKEHTQDIAEMQRQRQYTEMIGLSIIFWDATYTLYQRPSYSSVSTIRSTEGSLDGENGSTFWDFLFCGPYTVRGSATNRLYSLTKGYGRVLWS